MLNYECERVNYEPSNTNKVRSYQTLFVLSILLLFNRFRKKDVRSYFRTLHYMVWHYIYIFIWQRSLISSPVPTQFHIFTRSGKRDSNKKRPNSNSLTDGFSSNDLLTNYLISSSPSLTIDNHE